MPLSVVILAAGKGKRMMSPLPKIIICPLWLIISFSPLRIKLNPFWKEVKPNKKSKKTYREQYGLKLQKIIVATDTYKKLVYSLLGVKNE